PRSGPLHVLAVLRHGSVSDSFRRRPGYRRPRGNGEIPGFPWIFKGTPATMRSNCAFYLQSRRAAMVALELGFLTLVVFQHGAQRALVRAGVIAGDHSSTPPAGAPASGGGVAGG